MKSIALGSDPNAAGLKEVTLLPPMERARENFRVFAEEVMARY